MTPLVDHLALAQGSMVIMKTAVVTLVHVGTPTGGQHMTSADLGTRYRLYLDVLNERRLDDLVHYVQDELSYNGETMTRRQYQNLIATDITAIPDLTFDAQIIVASDDHVACRLVFNCTPQHQFLGFSPNGERLCFAEHVFYYFRDGRITAVWSLIDRPAIEAQLRQTDMMTSTGMPPTETV
jgi:predicted ester cyclase